MTSAEGIPVESSKPVIATLELHFHETRFEVATAVSRAVAAQQPARSADDSLLVDLRAGQLIRIGRDRANDIIIRDRNISRFHAVFSASASGVVLSDLSSLNGTYVNGNRISTPLDINSSDEIKIGDTVVSIHIGGDQAKTEDSLLGFTQASRMSTVSTTVLVADVCSYTTLSEVLPPEEVAESMNRWFCDVSAVVAKHGGEVDKFIGDCVMALWRSDKAGMVEAAGNALSAGIEVLEGTEEFSKSALWKYHQTHPWRCRIALNTGEALMGALGGSVKRDITVLGDTVNTAFRLEEAAGEFETSCVMSSTTALLVADSRPVRSLGLVNVPGKRDAVEVFTLAEQGRSAEEEERPKINGEAAAVVERLKEHPCIMLMLKRLEYELPETLAFHSLDHTLDVLQEAVAFAVADSRDDRELLLLGIAAAFHDSGYLFGAEDHEERSSELAAISMNDYGGFSCLEIELVQQMILDTKLTPEGSRTLHRISTPLSPYLVDADLSNFGRNDFFKRLELFCCETGMSHQEARENTLRLMERHSWACSEALRSRETQKQANIKELQQRIASES